jgi:predicted HicB family RNase H-like nuclease
MKGGVMSEHVKTSRMTLRMPKRVKDWAKKRADERGISTNTQIILTLQEKMETKEVPDDHDNYRKLQG